MCRRRKLHHRWPESGGDSTTNTYFWTTVDAEVVQASQSEARTREIFDAIASAQLVARSRAHIALHDSMIESYREAGLFGPCSQQLE